MEDSRRKQLIEIYRDGLLKDTVPVSYTHLTLPTILRV